MTAAAAPPAVQLHDGLAEVVFDHFDLEAYALFLRCKQLPERQVSYDWRADAYHLTTPARFAGLLDTALAVPEVARLPLPAHLFDYQRWAVERALDAERFALWADTGLGKTAMALEWTRQVQHLTGGRVLIVAPLQLLTQHQEEATRWYGASLPLERIETREALRTWCTQPGSALGLTNWEKFIPRRGEAEQLSELRHLGGIVLDEASRLRTGGGVQKWAVIKSSRGIRFKLSCTATPAPNEAMEYASQAAFLEKLRAEGDVLWTFFSRDNEGTWHIKPHAQGAFYQFMASWSLYLRDPARFGWHDILASLPPPQVQEHPVDMTDEQAAARWDIIAAAKKGGGLFSHERLGITERMRLAQIARGFLYDANASTSERKVTRIPSLKPAVVADLVRQERRDGHQVLVWTIFDEESVILAEQLAEISDLVGVLDGKMPEAARQALISRFKSGELPILISKARLLGLGLNFQNCRAMVFSGIDDSFEALYQAIRRAYRFGQTETVRVHIPYVPELEGLMFTNVKAKEERFLHDVAIQEAHYRVALGLAPRLETRGNP